MEEISMFADNRTISHRQLFRQIVLCFTGVLLVVVPALSGLSGARGVPVCFLCMVYLYLEAFFLFVFGLAMRDRRNIWENSGAEFSVCFISLISFLQEFFCFF